MYLFRGELCKSAIIMQILCKLWIEPENKKNNVNLQCARKNVVRE